MDFPGNLTQPAAQLFIRISNLLKEQHIPAYVVGGFLRDVLLKRETADMDIAAVGDALEIAQRVAAVLGGRYVLLDKVNGVARIVLANEKAPSARSQWQLDFSTLKGNIEQDLAQRDFTIDALAVDLNQWAEKKASVPLIDPLHGWRDLRQGVIRTTSEVAFKSDAARLLRAVRLAAELGFSIERETEAQLQRYAHLISGVAGERIREELLKLLAVPQAESLLPYLDKVGLLTATIPELAQSKGVAQPKEHFWDVFEHTIQTVIAVDFLLRQGKCPYAGEKVLAAAPWSATLAQHFESEVSSGSNRRILLKLAALLHDSAKPQAKAIDARGRVRFLGHAQEGATIAANILERLRFSSKEIKLVELMVRYHLRPTQMSNEGLPSNKAIYRYFRDTGDAGIDILFLSLADHLATRGPKLTLTYWQEHTKVVEYVLAQRFQQESLVVPPKLVDGHDLINIFGLSPGPRIGELLEAVREAQASGELKTREEALAYIREHLLSKTS